LPEPGELFPVAGVEAEHDEAELIAFLRGLHALGGQPTTSAVLKRRLGVGWSTVVRLLAIGQRDRLVLVRSTSKRKATAYFVTPAGLKRAGVDADPNTARTLDGVDPFGD
jgi:hypothetical protein